MVSGWNPDAEVVVHPEDKKQRESKKRGACRQRRTEEFSLLEVILELIPVFMGLICSPLAEGSRWCSCASIRRIKVE